MRKFAVSIIAICLLAMIPTVLDAKDCPEYPEDLRKMVIETMMDRPVVREAGMLQEECRLNLYAAVYRTTDEDHAKDIGDDFVRLAKAIGPGESPSKRIGKGIYDYVVAIFHVADYDLPFVLGAKAANAYRIIW